MSIVFVKTAVDFTLDGKNYKFDNVDLIEEGIPELCKISGNNACEFNLDTSFMITLKPAVTFKTFTVEGQIFVERDANGSLYGIRFIDKNENFAEFLKKEGKPFNKWKRSSPRIPSSAFASAVPDVRIMAKTDQMPDYTPLEILNISLGGVALFGPVDDSRFFKINEVALCKVTSEDLDSTLYFTARVVRISTFADLFRKKGVRVMNQFGMKFVEFDEENKKRFLALINRILDGLKK